MFSPLPHTLLFTSTLITGTTMALSSSNWLMIWMGLELNLLSFIPMIMSPTMNQESEAAMKYFISQAPGSMMLIFSMLLYFHPKETILPDKLIMSVLILSLLLKLGMAPCHWWFPSVCSKLSWPMNLILMTWQKLAPILILLTLTKNLNNTIILLAISMGAMTGGLTGLNQTNMRPLLAFSSISHMSWMMAANLMSYTTSIIYLLTYMVITTSIILFINLNFTNSSMAIMSWQNINPTTTIPMSILLMSMGGLPPLLGFIPKALTLEILVTSNMFFITTILLLGALLNLSFYMNISFNLFCHPYSAKKTHQSTNMNILLTLLATSPILIFPLTLYVMIMIFHPFIKRSHINTL